MRTFSQRLGLVKIRTTFQTNDLDEPTRNALWNIIGPFFRSYARCCSVYTDIWTELFHNPYDMRPEAAGPYDSDDEHFYSFYKSIITQKPWNTCLDLIDFLNKSAFRGKWNEEIYERTWKRPVPSAETYNNVFRKYLVGYHVVNDLLLPITNDQEIEVIEQVAKQAPDAVAEQICKAIRFLADRHNPDYAKSVDCSISAVESQCRILLKDPKPTLGKALKQLEDNGVALHGSLKAGFDKLYGFTSDANGIRHAGLEPSDIDADLAKFMLVACSAFVNYLRSKA